MPSGGFEVPIPEARSLEARAVLREVVGSVFASEELGAVREEAELVRCTGLTR
jgi:hypothetical protein